MKVNPLQILEQKASFGQRFLILCQFLYQSGSHTQGSSQKKCRALLCAEFMAGLF